MKYLDELKLKVLKDLKIEIKKEFEENIHTWLYLRAQYNQKIMRGLEYYKPKEIKMYIEWELEDE